METRVIHEMTRVFFLVVISLTACNDDGAVAHTDLSASSDLSSVVDLGPDLAEWCRPSGHAPSCGGSPCAPGCWCDYTVPFPDAGNPNVNGICNCKPAPPAGPTSPQDPETTIICCGGVYCPTSRGNFLSCDAQNDCN